MKNIEELTVEQIDAIVEYAAGFRKSERIASVFGVTEEKVKDAIDRTDFIRRAEKLPAEENGMGYEDEDAFDELVVELANWIMTRTTFSEEIKSHAKTVKQWAKDNFDNITLYCDDEPMYYDTNNSPRYGSWDGVLQEIEFKDIIDDRIPDWVYNEEYTEEEEYLLEGMYENLFPEFDHEYVSEWDSMTEDYYNNKEKDAEEELGTDERCREYREELDRFECCRDSYYGYCMHGGGGIKAFRKMYGDGNYKSYGEWLLANYGE